MTDPVNLNRARKAKARADKKLRADENSTKFGRTKAERARDRAENEKRAALLRQSKLE
ncbi:MAG: DUF4169 family protein [Rhodobacteraceae bacterium]|nr:DUF4169 family protein [Paracoccaceae bacterium]